MMSVAHMPKRLQTPRAASTDKPTIITPVKPTPTRLHTNTKCQRRLADYASLEVDELTLGSELGSAWNATKH